MMFSEEEKMGSPLVGETQLSESLVNAGKNLLKPHSSTQALLHLLNVRIILSTFSDFVTFFSLQMGFLCLLKTPLGGISRFHTANRVSLFLSNDGKKVEIFLFAL